MREGGGTEAFDLRAPPSRDFAVNGCAVPYPELSVVVPAFNEARRLPRSAPGLSALAEAGAEVIVVDDGSTDHTAENARRLLGGVANMTIIQLPFHQGKGAAVRAGVALARGRSIVFMDADLATDLVDLPKLIGALQHAHIAVGSRAAPGSQLFGTTALRSTLGKGFNHVVRRISGIEMLDTQCGFKAFRASTAKLLFHLGTINGFAFDVEVLALAARLGFRTTEIAVRWTEVPGSHINTLKDPLRMALDVLQMRAKSGALPRVVPCVSVTHPESDPQHLTDRVTERVRCADSVVSCRHREVVVLLAQTPTRYAALVASRLQRDLPGSRVGVRLAGADAMMSSLRHRPCAITGLHDIRTRSRTVDATEAG
jgi:dolichyl-phosphate beta-glucosyltransferase